MIEINGWKWPEYPLFLAPMAGVTDWIFRLICQEQGCDAATTEMISAQGYLTAKKNRNAYRLPARRAPFERPLLAQLFGADPKWIGEAAGALSGLGRFAAIDLNMGCPARKVTGSGSGSALMRDERLAGRIVREAVRASRIPVSVKMRLGWDEAHENAEQIARIAEQEGAAFLTVHGRTAAQQYSGQADYDKIARVRQAVRIPVIANGDVRDGESALRALKTTGCAGLAIGRAALGDPWVFYRVRAALNGQECAPPPLEERVRTARRHARLMRADRDERTALLEMRKFYAWYIKGVPGAAEIRAKVTTADSFEEVDALLTGCFGRTGKIRTVRTASFEATAGPHGPYSSVIRLRYGCEPVTASCPFPFYRPGRRS